MSSFGSCMPPGICGLCTPFPCRLCHPRKFPCQCCDVCGSSCPTGHTLLPINKDPMGRCGCTYAFRACAPCGSTNPREPILPSPCCPPILPRCSHGRTVAPGPFCGCLCCGPCDCRMNPSI